MCAKIPYLDVIRRGVVGKLPSSPNGSDNNWPAKTNHNDSWGMMGTVFESVELAINDLVLPSEARTQWLALNIGHFLA